MWGELLIFSDPPARPKLESPNVKLCMTDTIACNPDPHKRFTFIAATLFGKPEFNATTLERYISLGSVLIT